jgi:hypothetical protein
MNDLNLIDFVAYLIRNGSGAAVQNALRQGVLTARQVMDATARAQRAT